MFTQFRSNTPQLYMDIDRTKVEALGVTIEDVNETLQIYLGSLYVNNFNEFGRYWQVNLQAEGRIRNRVADLNLLKVRNNRGEMVPLGTLVKVRDDRRAGHDLALQPLHRRHRSTATCGPGSAPGEAIAVIDDAGRTDPAAFHDQPSGPELMFMQIRAGDTAIVRLRPGGGVRLPGAGGAVRELVAAAGGDPGGADVPALLGRRRAAQPRRSIIFVQIGFVVLVGLASKNAILIVEFARQPARRACRGGEATLEACRLRLRPILMTSFAFILGVVPLVFAEGAGAEMRRSLGTAVFSGMLGVTLFGIFLTPVFFSIIDWIGETAGLASPGTRRFGLALIVLLNIVFLGIPALLRTPRPGPAQAATNRGGTQET